MDAIPDDFARALGATEEERGVFGARLHYVAQTGSTNDLAASAADSPASAMTAAPTVIRTLFIGWFLLARS